MQTVAVDAWRYTIHALSGDCLLRGLSRRDARNSVSVRRTVTEQPRTELDAATLGNLEPNGHAFQELGS
jgi:hypothetical protein